MKRAIIILLTLMVSVGVFAQESITISVLPKHIKGVEVFLDNTDRSFAPDAKGRVRIEGLDPSKAHILAVFADGYATKTFSIYCSEEEIEVRLEPIQVDLSAVEVIDLSRTAVGMTELKYIEVDGLYAAKKNEIVLPEELTANRSTNNGRQIFAKVPGINVQETDAGGLQLGIGARGLDPKRTTNFNTRQDGYDISADALGYPESYYAPPMEAVERIELVRGAASLQYGTQFGGLLNFRMKRGNEDRTIEVTQRTTLGSYSFFNSFTSLGGTAGEWNYYGFYQHKQGEGWRPNAHFVNNATYIQAGRQLGERWSVDVAYTHSFYTAKQPGGLTDRQFESNPGESFRDRNWFQVQWNVANATINGQLTKTLSINSKTFLLKSSRAALGFLGNINRLDTGGLRDLILGEFNNVGNETRLIQRFNVSGNPGAILLGTRLYHGDTRNTQGKASAGNGPDFRFVQTRLEEGSDIQFPSRNAAFFSEVLIPLSGCWYLTPGMRIERIETRSSGQYREITRHPLTQEVLAQSTVEVQSDRPRTIALFGLGASWRCNPNIELYTNASQNYRAMNFSDLYVNNPNLVVARDMKDEKGYTLDLGVKGSLFNEVLRFDGGLFLMQYQDRIGETLRTIIDDEGVARVVNYRDNIADARFFGVEFFEEMDLFRLGKGGSDWSLTWFNNVAVVEASYLSSEMSSIGQNRVENVPRLNYRTGIQLRKGGFAGGLQYNYVGEQFTDATNATYFPDATVGLIPSFQVIDATVNYTWNRLRLEWSLNNVTDAVYFTRRATGYPGPGIIPAERRMFYFTLEFTL